MGFIVAAIVGIGAAVGATAIATTLTSIGITIAASTIAAVGISLALASVASALMGPKVPESQLSRLNVSLEPTTPRKMVFGTTAMNLDLRYHEASGTNQEYIDYIIAVAAHKVKSIDQIWFEEKLAWSATGGVTSTYSGYLTVSTITEGSSTNYFTVNSGTKWGSAQRLTGCAQVKIRIKRSGPNDKTQSPLVNGLPNRITIIGDGAFLYDPRKDSTVPGGSGMHRANDQSTWGTYTNADDTDNPVLQLLWYLLGWKINGQLSVGCGVPPERIDLESFITAANVCDENVTLNGGGTQKRYRTSGTASDADNRMDVINTFLACMNASLRDNAGKLALTIIKNDLADYVLTFNDGDVLDEFEWNQTRGLSESYNKVRGRYVDPSNNSLYQLVDYPEVGFASPDGIDRVMTLDLPYVENGRRAQRIAKQVLQRNQYKGTFSAVFTAKAQGCTVGEVVRLSFTPLGWANKPFRVISQEIRFDGQVPMVLIEENAAIYAWDAEDVTPVVANTPTVYDPLNNPIWLGIESASGTADWDQLNDVPLELTDGRILVAVNSDGTIADGQVVNESVANLALAAAKISDGAASYIAAFSANYSGDTIPSTGNVFSFAINNDGISELPILYASVQFTPYGTFTSSSSAHIETDLKIGFTGGGAFIVAGSTSDIGFPQIRNGDSHTLGYPSVSSNANYAGVEVSGYLTNVTGTRGIRVTGYLIGRKK